MPKWATATTVKNKKAHQIDAVDMINFTKSASTGQGKRPAETKTCSDKERRSSREREFHILGITTEKAFSWVKMEVRSPKGTAADLGSRQPYMEGSGYLKCPHPKMCST